MRISSPPLAPIWITLATILVACGGPGPDDANGDSPGLGDRPRYVVGIDREFPPYSFVDRQGRIDGFAVDVTRAVADVMAFDVELRSGTYDEIIAGLADGTIDIIPHLAPSPELEERFGFSLTMIDANDAIFVREDATAVFTEAHLNQHPTLVWNADEVRDYLDRQDIAPEILDESSVADTLRRLAAGEGDCALVPHLTGLQLASELKLSNLRIAGPPIEGYTRGLSFAVRRDEGALLTRLDDGLSLVTRTQRFSELYDFWFGVQEAAVSTEALRRWLLWVTVPLLSLILIAVFWSISLRRTVAKRTAELRESEERLEGILDNAPMMIYMKDAQGRYMVVNREFEKLVGQHRHQVRDATDSKFFTPLQVAELRALDAKVFDTGEIIECQEVFATPVGQRTFRSVRFPLHHADGSVYAVCAINADITDQMQAEEEKKKLEAQIQQSQKLESLGVLAGGIAHDFNNLLMGILGNTGLALLELDPDSPIRGHLRDVERTSKRAADLCKQMLAYSGKGRFIVQPIDITRLVIDMTHLLQVSISKKATLEKDFGTGLPAFEADATQIRQVVMNLITNASEALQDTSGTITLRTGVKACDAEYLEQTYLAEQLEPGTYVFLEVRDTGCGMDAATRERIFDPFFSTKFAGRGLGLAATLGIVRGHQGALEVESEAGEGTTFRVLFPASDKPISDTAPDAAPVLEMPGAAGTILVVDDEVMVLTIARRVLERSGYRVLTAQDGEEGFDIFRRHSDDISLVLLDVTMPRMDGDETFRRMRRLRSDLRVLLTSGYNEREATNRLSEPGPAGFIQKPYAPAALLRKVREVMN